MTTACRLPSVPLPAAADLLGRPGDAGGRASAPDVLRAWRLRQSYRADLRRLLRIGPYLIDDVGLTLGEAVEEARKPFWRA